MEKDAHIKHPGPHERLVKPPQDLGLRYHILHQLASEQHLCSAQDWHCGVGRWLPRADERRRCFGCV